MQGVGDAFECKVASKVLLFDIYQNVSKKMNEA